MNCPSCGALLPDGGDECIACGVIASKWRQRQGRTRESPLPRTSAPLQVPGTAIVPRRSKGLTLSSATAVVVAVVIIAILSAIVWFVARRGGEAIGSKVTDAMASLDPALTPGRDFDLAFKLPGSPLGIASNGAELLVGRRNEPGGAMRLKPNGSSFVCESVAMKEPTYEQSISVASLAWNGRNYVGITTASWFGKSTGNVFTIHDPKTLRVLSTKPAPSGLGGLAYDGHSYWAASRRNTRDADEPAKLYELDDSLQVVATYDPPGVGCQGLAYDGTLLWFVDVFEDAIILLDVAQTPPREVHRSRPGLAYLSGVAFYDRHIWVSEYGEGRILRLASGTRLAWMGSHAPVGETNVREASAASGGDVDALLGKLRSNDEMAHVSAQMKLDDMRAPVPYDHDSNDAHRGPEEADLIEWSVELKNGRIYGTWTLWFGEKLFTGKGVTSGPIPIEKFARYTITVNPPGDAPDVEKIIEATPGENRLYSIDLGPAEEPGEYEVELFIHVQYEAPDGTAKILNRSFVPLSLRR